MIIDLDLVLRNITQGRSNLRNITEGKPFLVKPETLAEAKRDLAKLDEALSLASRIADGWVA